VNDPRVTSVVINWNRKEDTCRCLQSLERSSEPCRVIVVDNGSEDGSGEFILRHFPQVELIALASNAGFGAACNRALSLALGNASCDFAFLVNNDAVVHPQALGELLYAAQAHPEAGILGPKIYYQDDPHRIWYAGARRRRAVLAAADTGRGQKDRGQFDELREVDYVFGTAMLVRKSVFEKVGFFDERFFLYLEDLDFCLRVQKAGFSLLFVPQAEVWHKGSASTLNASGMRKFHLVRSTVRFLRKHAVLGSSLPIVGFWTLVSLRAVAVDLAHGDFKALRVYGLGLADGLADQELARGWAETS
jgi:GT2 family glycosyltransferase